MTATLNGDAGKRAGAVDPPLFEDETGAVPASSFEYGDSMFARLQRLEGSSRWSRVASNVFPMMKEQTVPIGILAQWYLHPDH
jgi:hypothetical protein